MQEIFLFWLAAKWCSRIVLTSGLRLIVLSGRSRIGQRVLRLWFHKQLSWSDDYCCWERSSSSLCCSQLHGSTPPVCWLWCWSGLYVNYCNLLIQEKTITGVFFILGLFYVGLVWFTSGGGLMCILFQYMIFRFLSEVALLWGNYCFHFCVGSV